MKKLGKILLALVLPFALMSFTNAPQDEDFDYNAVEIITDTNNETGETLYYVVGDKENTTPQVYFYEGDRIITKWEHFCFYEDATNPDIAPLYLNIYGYKIVDNQFYIRYNAEEWECFDIEITENVRRLKQLAPQDEEETDRLTLEDIKKIITDEFTLKADDDLKEKIIEWVVLLVYLIYTFICNVRTGKFDAKNIKTMILGWKDELLPKFEELDRKYDEKLDRLAKQYENNLNTIVKALVLGQDHTTEGKVALLEMLKNTTETKEVNALIKEEINKAKQELKAEKQLEEDIKGDYKGIL